MVLKVVVIEILTRRVARSNRRELQTEAGEGVLADKGTEVRENRGTRDSNRAHQRTRIRLTKLKVSVGTMQ